MVEGARVVGVVRVAGRGVGVGVMGVVGMGMVRVTPPRPVVGVPRRRTAGRVSVIAPVLSVLSVFGPRLPSLNQTRGDGDCGNATQTTRKRQFGFEVCIRHR